MSDKVAWQIRAYQSTASAAERITLELKQNMIKYSRFKCVPPCGLYSDQSLSWRVFPHGKGRYISGDWCPTFPDSWKKKNMSCCLRSVFKSKVASDSNIHNEKWVPINIKARMKKMDGTLLRSLHYIQFLIGQTYWLRCMFHSGNTYFYTETW